jgi:hypothetical protein
VCRVGRGYFVLLLLKRDELAGSMWGTWPAPYTSRLSSTSASSSSSLLSGTTEHAALALGVFFLNGQCTFFIKFCEV